MTSDRPSRQSGDRFEYDTAIATWRRFMSTAHGLSTDDLDELETHLRDEVDELVTAGASPEDAFREARRRIGDYRTVEAAYEPMLWRKIRHEHRLRDELTSRASMIRNHIRVALRNLLSHKVYSIINVLGLAVGIAGTLIILLFVYDELSYDDHHEHAESVYRVAREWIDPAGEVTFQLARISAPIAPALENEFPVVERAVRIWGGGGLISRGDEFVNEPGLYFADEDFFDVFTAPVLRGDPERALTEPYTIVLTEGMADKWFGSDDPMGEVLRLEDEWDLTVTGVIEDPPRTTHFDYDFLVSFATLEAVFPASSFESWTGNNNHATYVRLTPGADPAGLQAALPAFLEARYDEEPGEKSRLFLQPITDIHLRSSLGSEFAPNGDIANVYLFSVVAFLILVIACFNFMSLATARAFRRSREIGVRKALGAARSQVAWQFMGETLVLAFFALLAAAALSTALLPVFNELSGKTLAVFDGYAAVVVGGLIGLTLFAGLLAGSYPALYLSKFRPVDVLRGDRSPRGGASIFRKTVVVTQFVVSIVLISGAAIVYRQIGYVQQKDLGFESENLVVLPGSGEITEDFASVRARLTSHPNIESVTASRLVPSDRLVDHIDGTVEVDGELRPFSGLPLVPADQEFVATYGIDVVAGRTMSVDRSSDSTEAYIVNEAAVRRLGWSSPEDAVGSQLTLEASSFTRPGTVVGVVEDFHFESLREEISPLVMFVMPERHRLVTVRMTGDDQAAALEFLQSQWAEFLPNFPFTYRLIDQDFDELYQSDERMADVIGAFALLAIFVACLGLFGLAAFMAQQRTKEIGIRKALGASVAGVVGLLTMEFVKLVLIAILIAAPLAWLLARRWLEDFAYAVDPGAGIILGAGLAVLLLAMLTVSYQAVRAAVADPVDSLRTE